jgi:hypothetical protein
MPRQQSSLPMSLRCVAAFLDKIDRAAAQLWRTNRRSLRRFVANLLLGVGEELAQAVLEIHRSMQACAEKVRPQFLSLQRG